MRTVSSIYGVDSGSLWSEGSRIVKGATDWWLVKSGGRDSRRLVSKISAHVIGVAVERTILQLSTLWMINQLVSSLHYFTPGFLLRLT